MSRTIIVAFRFFISELCPFYFKLNVYIQSNVLVCSIIQLPFSISSCNFMIKILVETMSRVSLFLSLKFCPFIVFKIILYVTKLSNR